MKSGYHTKKTAMWLLYDSYKKNNQQRNRILIAAVALGLVFLFFVFSFIKARIDADTNHYMIESGATVNTYLENGTAEMVSEINALPYVEKTGIEKSIGNLHAKDHVTFSCKILDEIAYEEIIKPTFSEVYGQYPQKVNEIMLSESTLNHFGIVNPGIGMELELEFYWNSWQITKNSGKQTFVLSGYYRNRDYDDSVAYISMDRLNESHVDLYPARILIDINKWYLSGTQIESMLYEDISMDSDIQRFVSRDSARYAAMDSILGGYGIFIYAGSGFLCIFVNL